MRLNILKKNEEVIGFMLEGLKEKEFVKAFSCALKKGQGSILIKENQITITIKIDRGKCHTFLIGKKDAIAIKRHIENQKMVWIRDGFFLVSLRITFHKQFTDCESCILAD